MANKPGLYANIAAKKKRIAAGSGEKMRSVGAKGAPKKSDFTKAAKTASFKEGRGAESKVKVVGGGGADKQGAGLGGRLSTKKEIAKDLELEGYLEGFAVKPKDGSSKAKLTGGGVKLTKRFEKGGEAKSRVNEAGNYTKPGMRKAIFERIKAGGKGGAPGQWSARKAQMTAQAYKKAGGGYKD